MIMDYYALAPEVAGALGERTVMDSSVHPPLVARLHYEIDYGWLGDELLEAFPCYIVSDTIAANLAESGLGAFELHDADVTLTPEAQEDRAGEPVPLFRWLRVSGIAGRDDLGVTGGGRLVVSERTLALLRTGVLDHCDADPYLADEARPPR